MPDRVHVDTGPRPLGQLTLEQVWDADGELDHLDTALDVAERIGHRLAVLDGQQFGEFVCVGVDQFDELHHHAGPPLRIPCAPLLLGVDRHGNGHVNVGRRGEQHLGLDLAGAGVEHVRGAGAGQVVTPTIDEVLNCGAHELPSDRGGGDTCIS